MRYPLLLEPRVIIFNAFAIIVGIICGIFLGPLYWAFPVLMDSTWDALGVAYRAGLMPKTDESQKTEIPSEFTGALQELLGNKGKLPEDEDRKDLLEALNKAALPAVTT